MASVTVRKVRKAYGDVEVVHGLDLAIADGAFVVLLGPSGCGKSTLLRMIAGLEPITAGEIDIGGQVVNGLHPKDRNIAMVFQNYALYAHMTVFDNMAFSMQLKKLPKDEIRRKVDWAASILNLTPYLARYPRQLSGGQRQRVAMGRAIVRDPAVFLFDEPLSNLDAKLRVQMRTEIKELHQRLRTTTVYVTHDQIEAMTMADVIVILRDGYIEQVGRPLEVYDRPANLFVAEFIGSPAMNILRGEVVAHDGAPAVDVGNLALPLPSAAPVAPGQRIVYGIRPEHLRPAGPAAGIPARVSVLEPTGPDIHIYADLGGHEVCAITQDRVEVEPGSEIRLAPMLDRVHVFDAETGLSLRELRAMAEIVVLGAGVMGSAMALPAAHSGNRVSLVGTHLDEQIVGSVAGNGHHPRLGVTLPPAVEARPWTAFGDVMARRPDLLVLGVSSAGVGWAVDRIVESAKTPVPILMITKGLAVRDGGIEVLPRLVAREIERRTAMAMPVMAVGGPCIAGELAATRDTSVVVTGLDAGLIDRTLGLLDAPFYHARRSDDVVGVEICAAFKNFFALGVGAAAGRLEQAGKAGNGALMHNLAASAFTQALLEMTVLVEALGGRADTVMGLAGSGDLYVTCQAGRNSRMGRLLGLGLPYSRAKAEHMAADTVEGAQLALDLGPTLEAMMARGDLPGDRLPLLSAIVATVCRDDQLELAFDRFQR